MTTNTCFMLLMRLTIVDQDVQASHEFHLQPRSWGIKPIGGPQSMMQAQQQDPAHHTRDPGDCSLVCRPRDTNG